MNANMIFAFLKVKSLVKMYSLGNVQSGKIHFLEYVDVCVFVASFHVQKCGPKKSQLSSR